MKFDFLDHVIEQSADRIVAVKQVSRAEEYLADHFPGFPVFPGVFMLETMVHAARRLVSDRADGPLVLGRVQGLKYGSMVRPGEALEVEVTLQKELDDGGFQFRGTGKRRRAGREAAETAETAVSGRFTIRPVRASDISVVTADASAQSGEH